MRHHEVPIGVLVIEVAGGSAGVARLIGLQIGWIVVTDAAGVVFVAAGGA